MEFDICHSSNLMKCTASPQTCDANFGDQRDGYNMYMSTLESGRLGAVGGDGGGGGNNG